MPGRRAHFGAGAEHVGHIQSLKQRDPTKFWSVSTPGKGYKSSRLPGGVGYVSTKATKESVDVGGLVGLPGTKGVARAAFAHVDNAHPFHPQTLDAFDERTKSGNMNLPDLYAKHGFTETGRMGFDPQYAPKEWDESKHGRPDVVMMSRPAAQGSLFPKEYPTTPPRSSRSSAMRAGIAGARPDGGIQDHLPGV
jgi:hypothetical protein